MVCWSSTTFAQIREQLETVITDGGTYCIFDINEESDYYLQPSLNSIPEEEVKDELRLNLQQKFNENKSFFGYICKYKDIKKMFKLDWNW